MARQCRPGGPPTGWGLRPSARHYPGTRGPGCSLKRSPASGARGSAPAPAWKALRHRRRPGATLPAPAAGSPGPAMTHHWASRSSPCRPGIRSRPESSECHPQEPSHGCSAADRTVRSASHHLLRCRPSGALLQRTWFYLPDVAGVFRNGAVTRKLAGMPYIEDRLARPRVGLRVQGAHLCLGIDIGRQISKVSVIVPMRQEHVQDRGKNPRLVRAESIGGDHLEGAAGLRLMVIVPLWVVPAAAVLHLFCRQAEEEKVLLARLLSHFDRSAVTRANGQGAVHHELHVTRAAGFIAGRRDLFRDVAGGDQSL